MCSKIDRKKAPWSTRRIKRLSSKKRKLWDKYRFSHNQIDHNNYKSALNEFNREKETAIRQYENNVIANKSSNPKQYFRYVSRNDKYKDNSISLTRDGEVESDPEKCANLMNEFFSTVFTEGSSDTRDMPVSSIYEPMPDIQIIESSVRNKINNLNIHKSVGPDGISAYLLKKAVDVFAPLLTKLFKKSYETALVPKLMKSANIVPIFKQGDKRSPNNYRPVSIIAVIAKIFESLIKEEIEKHIIINQIIVKQQHGFCTGKSTSTNLIEFWEQITDAAENKSSMSIIYTDQGRTQDFVKGGAKV